MPYHRSKTSPSPITEADPLIASYAVEGDPGDERPAALALLIVEAVEGLVVNGDTADYVFEDLNIKA